MHLGLDEEQEALAGTVRALLARRADSQAVRAAAASDAGYDTDLWRTLCEQIGAAALTVPEEYDGAGATLFEAGIVLDELGHSLAPAPLLPAVVVAEALRAVLEVDAATGAAHAADLLSRVAAGEVAALAWSGASGLPARREPVVAVTAGDGTHATGEVRNVPFAAQAEVLVVAAHDGERPVLLAVDPSDASVERTPAMDTTWQLGTVRLEAAPATVLAADATAALDRAHLAGTVALTSLQLGCARRGLEMTVSYAKERVQFGRPIGSFQALKHRLADLLVLVEMSRSAVWAATHAVAVDAPDAETLAAAAASYCTEALDRVAAETVQLHGGLAITWEHDAQMVFKRAHALRQLIGLPHLHRASLVG